MIRIDPGPRESGGLGSVLGTALSFFTNPGATVLAGVQNERGPLQGAGVLADDQTGVVSLDLDAPNAVTAWRNLPRDLRRRQIGRVRVEEANRALPLLQETYTTGVIQPGIPQGYQAAARVLASNPFAPPPPVTFTPQPIATGGLVPIIPPGGMASFSQQVPAVKLALTKGVRGTRSRRRKSAKKRTTKRAKRASGGGRKPKFGSPAFQKKYGVGKYAKKRRK